MNSKTGVYFAIGLLLVVVLGAFVLPGREFASVQFWTPASTTEASIDSERSIPLNRSSTPSRRSLQDDEVQMGGLVRKSWEVDSPQQPSNKSVAETEPEEPDYGTVQPLPLENPAVQSMIAATESNERPERLSPVIKPTPFDLQKFEQDPESYLHDLQPGRVFDTAQPGPDVRPLQRESPYFQQVVQGSSVTLQVNAPPGSLVTFHSFDLGEFSNHLTTQNVIANDQGVAEVEFFGSPGTAADVNILAGGPMTSGRVRFRVRVLPNPDNQ